MRRLSDALSRLCQSRYFNEIVKFQHHKYDRLLGIKKEDLAPDGQVISSAGKEKIIKFRTRVRRFNAFLGLAVLVLTIAGVEKTIQYNSLSAPTDLTRPGQIIPFMLGIVTLLEGVSKAFRPYKPPAPTSGTFVWDDSGSENDLAAQPEDNRGSMMMENK